MDFLQQLENRQVLAVRLHPYVQHYDWGMQAAQSLVASLAAATDASTTADVRRVSDLAEGESTLNITSRTITTEPRAARTQVATTAANDRGSTNDTLYAELWMGAHPSGMNTVREAYTVVVSTAARTALKPAASAESNRALQEMKEQSRSATESARETRSSTNKCESCCTNSSSSDKGSTGRSSPSGRENVLVFAEQVPLDLFLQNTCAKGLFLLASRPSSTFQQSQQRNSCSDGAATKSCSLPFLFKVLSVRKPLSIQAHPSAEDAAELHATDKKNFPDKNPKPEIAVAVGDFEALSGFRPLQQITFFFTKLPELASLLLHTNTGEITTNSSSKDRSTSSSLSKSSSPCNCGGDSSNESTTPLLKRFATLVQAAAESERAATATAADSNAGAAASCTVFVNSLNEQQKEELLKETFKTVWQQPQQVLSRVIPALIARIKEQKQQLQHCEKCQQEAARKQQMQQVCHHQKGGQLEQQEHEELLERFEEAKKIAVRCYEIYSADVGVLAPFFLNYVKLKSGEALFTGPGILHCYLKGHCIECMANSDNVIRGGLTKKHKDLKRLLQLLRFASQNNCCCITPRQQLPSSSFSSTAAALPAASSQGAACSSMEQVPTHLVSQQQQPQGPLKGSRSEGTVWSYGEDAKLPADLSKFFVLFQVKLRYGESRLDLDCGGLLSQAAALLLVLNSPFSAATMRVEQRQKQPCGRSSSCWLPLRYGQVFLIAANTRLSVYTTQQQDKSAVTTEEAPESGEVLKNDYLSKLQVKTATTGNPQLTSSCPSQLQQQKQQQPQQQQSGHLHQQEPLLPIDSRLADLLNDSDSESLLLIFVSFKI